MLLKFSKLGAGALLIDANSGDILSLVSDINQRSTIKDKKFITKLQKAFTS